MPVKTPVKTVRAIRTKKSRTAVKLAKKAPKKVTWDEVQAGFKELHELNKEAEKTRQETEKTLKKAQDEAWAAIRETQKNIGGLGNTLAGEVKVW